MTTRKATATATADPFGMTSKRTRNCNDNGKSNYNDTRGMIDAVRVVYADIQWVGAGCVAGGVEEISAD
jgi:hypothetical protein